jgi:hypothetical protein
MKKLSAQKKLDLWHRLRDEAKIIENDILDLEAVKNAARRKAYNKVKKPLKELKNKLLAVQKLMEEI